MSQQRQFLRSKYGAYFNQAIPPEDAELTHVEKGSLD